MTEWVAATGRLTALASEAASPAPAARPELAQGSTGSRPKVLHVFKAAYPEQRGGIIEVMHAIAEGLDGSFDSAILTASNRPRLFNGPGSAPVFTSPHLGEWMSLPLAPALPVQLALLAPRYDLVALHAPFPLADVAGLAGTWGRTKLVVHWHSDVVRQTMFRSLYRPLMRLSLKRAARVIVSGPTLVSGSEFLRPVAGKCTVIPFGTPVERWNRLDEADHRAIAEIRAQNPRLVLAVGRLVSYKGFHILLNAISDLDCTLIVVGEGKLRRFLENEAALAGVSARVRFPGALPDRELRRLYHAARVLAFPSITSAETFGIVQIEAMACGLPVVNTALGTETTSVVRHGVDGLTVSPADPAALAEALRKLLDDPELRARFSDAARRRAHERYGIDAFLDAVRREYLAVLNG